jgi:hypothetical protein
MDEGKYDDYNMRDLDISNCYWFQFFCIFFWRALECAGHSFAYVAHFVFLEMSGFEPRDLPSQTGSLPT